jgi:UDP-N-acetylglucosamine--N-acetylmuramyl-(pentapeptide) pyrophosphoryl-undecaprenol N-acetylglucosamine transferase
MIRVVCAAGGTAGHIEPALNLADALREQDPEIDVTFLGAERGLESTLVPARGYPLVQVPAVPFPRRISGAAITFPWHVHVSVRQARRLLAGVSVVVGFGGYAAVPGYLAARRLKIPLVIHEANARAGFANRLGARFTTHIYATYPAALAGARHLGLPLSSAIAHVDRTADRAAARAHFGLGERVLLVFGGSQGAARLNAAVAEALPALREAGIDVLHAYGSRNPAPEPAEGYRPVPYIERMDLAYAAADFAVNRAGAMTCAELTGVGLPAMYVPLPVGNGEHALNAAPIVDAGGGLLLADAALTGVVLAEYVRALFAQPDRLVDMGRAAAVLGEPDSAPRMARIVRDAVVAS